MIYCVEVGVKGKRAGAKEEGGIYGGGRGIGKDCPGSWILCFIHPVRIPSLISAPR